MGIYGQSVRLFTASTDAVFPGKYHLGLWLSLNALDGERIKYSAFTGSCSPARDQFVRTHPNAIIGLAPEGQDSPLDGVGLAPAGGGKFMLQLNRMGLPLLPVAVAENSGQLTVRFGQVFDIAIETSIPPAQVDEYVRVFVRDCIGILYSRIE